MARSRPRAVVKGNGVLRSDARHIFNVNNGQCPYHAEYTGSHLITEVEQRRARLGLGWVTAWEHRTMLAFRCYFSSLALLTLQKSDQLYFYMCDISGIDSIVLEPDMVLGRELVLEPEDVLEALSSSRTWWDLNYIHARAGAASACAARESSERRARRCCQYSDELEQGPSTPCSEPTPICECNGNT
ncbi:hypothetical protein EVAR_30119_1 [Eumeta japonica]|uniref:Uncharacterized protein n=1 Tax=Eumeta variegata TaxID=151549 RepID=A0A4C1WGX1_EUMVA|nr:hypothetical protein EVAR_30119_1 [Eumeta japonica]